MRACRSFFFVEKIGIFDSGIGGLTLANALVEREPKLSFDYYGDTAHLPYGDKSPELVRHYSKGISQFLIGQGCSTILIACNTASATAYEFLASQFPDTQIVSVVDPTVAYVRKSYKSMHKIGVIGTRGTIQSGIYPRKIKENNPDAPEVVSKATPLLAPLIEEGFFNKNISKEVVADYLSDPEFADLDAIVLGCTHYPLIAPVVTEILGPKVEVIDSAGLVADHLLNHFQGDAIMAQRQFIVSDHTASFENSARFFFSEKFHLKELDIWEHEGK